jgi:hypothetical protein
MHEFSHRDKRLLLAAALAPALLIVLSVVGW